LRKHGLFVSTKDNDFSSHMKNANDTKNGVAQTVKRTFSRSTTISETINADRATVWSMLTNAEDFSRWNSTIVSMEGKIEQSGKIQLKSILDAKRTFKLKVKEFIPNEKLVWGDAMGERTFTLSKAGKATRFCMTEKIGGPIFPLFASKIPSFDASFEAFTTDLKKEAESK